ncbi:MAG: hypothetical protein U1E83_01315 [Methylotetracoccus sp.]
MARTPGSFSRARPAKDIRQRAWACMRYLGRFSPPEIQISADISYENLRKYLRALEKAGFVKRQRQKRNGEAAGHVIWLLVRNTGPKHPIARKWGGVYDPNTGEEYPVTEPATEPQDEQGGVARRTAPGL